MVSKKRNLKLRRTVLRLSDLDHFLALAASDETGIS